MAAATMSTRANANPSRVFSQRVEPIPADVRFMNATAYALIALAALLLAATALLWLARQPLFAIRAITVHGDTAHNSVVTIRANAAPHLAGNFMTIDLDAVRQAFESVPWVRHAIVRRVWPNRLRVQLEEHRPVALWGGDSTGSEQLVDSFGDVFEANVGDVEDDALPTLDGPDGSAGHVLAMRGRLLPVFATLGQDIKALELSSRGSWKATLDSGAAVEIGRGSDAEVLARAARFAATVGDVTSRYQRPLAHADLRHTDGYAVRLRGVSTTPDAAGAKPVKK